MSQSDFPDDATLRSEAGRTDYLVLPLAAGVLAHFALATDALLRVKVDPDIPLEGLAGLIDDARRVLEEARGPSDVWRDGPEPYAHVRDMALKAWATVSFWMPTMYVSWKFERGASLQDPKPVVKWLREHSSAPLVDIVLAGMLGIHIVTTEEDVLPLLCARARRIRVELAERAKREGLTSWPQIIQTVSSQWVDGGATRCALDLATAGQVAVDRIVQVHAEIESRWEALQAAEAAQAKKAARAATRVVPSISRKEHESILRGERERARAVEERLVALQTERDAMAAREGRLRSRIDALTARLEAVQERIVQLEAGQASPGDASEEMIAAAPSETAVQADALAGRRVILFTGQEAGDVREAMKASLQAYGAAEVTVYWSDRELGPDVVAPETIVVIDVRFMSHSRYEAVERIADRSGAWRCVTQRGAALLGQEVAHRFLQRRS